MPHEIRIAKKVNATESLIPALLLLAKKPLSTPTIIDINPNLNHPL
jgi:hypothetical protein